MKSGRRFMAVLLSLIIIPAALTAGCSSGGKKEGSAGTDTSGQTSGTAIAETKSLREFCDDAELDEWFDNIEENMPVKMTHILFGEGPVAMEFTDPELILRAVRALQTVQIGGKSKEDPDSVDDAGGLGFYFETEDGSSYGFSFVLGCFRWKDGEYHNVADYGALLDVSYELERIGNPQYVYAYADDNGFYTEYLETYRTDWKEEDGYGGGLFFYLGESEGAPYVSIARCTAGAAADVARNLSAEEFLAQDLAEAVSGEIVAEGGTVRGISGVQEYALGRKNLPGILFTADGPETDEEILVLVLQEEDSLLQQPAFIRFSAAYHPSADGEKELVMEALERAAGGFYFRYLPYKSPEVKPDNTLFEFCGDQRLLNWINNIEDHMPDELLYTEESWHLIKDKELIRRTLEALGTVRIGDVSSKHVGASGRKIFDFGYDENGAEQSFEFFMDTFFWGSKSYDVLDWGELETVLPELRKK